jgi:hypothetical protein
MTYSLSIASICTIFLIATLDTSEHINTPQHATIPNAPQLSLLTDNNPPGATQLSSLPTTQPSMEPMWTDIVQAIGSIGTILAAVIGFIFVIKQLRQVETTLRKDAIELLYERAFAIQNILLNESELRPYFFENAPVPSDPMIMAKLETYSEMVFDFYELIIDETHFMSSGLSQPWKYYLKDLYSRSPFLRRHLDMNQEWYSQALFAFFKQKASP